jgi:hypothetical protein
MCFTDKVVIAPDAFIVVASNFDDFGSATVAKFVRAIAALPAPGDAAREPLRALTRRGRGAT